MKISKLKWVLIVFSIFSILCMIGNVILIFPGLGMETLTFINGFKTAIDDKLPKDKYVFNIEELTKIKNKELKANDFLASMLASTALDTIKETLKHAVEQDVLSTIDSNFFNEDIFNKYKNFADDWFFKNIEINNFVTPSDLDLNDFSYKLIEFDKSVAKHNWGINPITNDKYSSNFGYVNNGFAWMARENNLQAFFNNFKTSSLMKNAEKNSKVIAQPIYNQNQMKITYKDLGGTDEWTFKGMQSHINRSHNDNGSTELINLPGTYIVNNKVWFLESQLETIKVSLSNVSIKLASDLGINTFKNQTTLSNETIDSTIEVEGMIIPNYDQALRLFRFANISLVIVVPMLIVANLAFVIVFVIIKQKHKKPSVL